MSSLLQSLWRQRWEMIQEVIDRTESRSSALSVHLSFCAFGDGDAVQFHRLDWCITFVPHVAIPWPVISVWNAEFDIALIALAHELDKMHMAIAAEHARQTLSDSTPIVV